MRWLRIAARAAWFLLAAPAAAQTATGPIPGKPVLVLGMFDLDEFGYVAEEYFISGEASSYEPAGTFTSDGRWSVKVKDKAPFVTRIVTIRPKDPARFNGTVVVEWMSTGGGGDSAPDWGLLHREEMRKGYAHAAVTTQRVGIYGNPSPGQAQALRPTDPARYERLVHPGDAYSYDILSQAGKMVREGRVLGRLKPKALLVTCSTITARFLVTYVNAIDPLARTFDGFFIRSRTANAAPLAPGGSEMPTPALFRSDLRVPVLAMITESDLLVSSYYRARVPDNNRLRVWEVAGTAHGDSYVFTTAFKDTGRLPIAELAKAYDPLHKAMGAEFPKPMNAAPQHHYVAWAALDALNRWVTTGRLPPGGPRLNMTTSEPVSFRLDPHGNVTGGIRTPWMDVPTRRLTGMTELASGIGRNYGMTEPFDVAKLRQLYPGGRADYVRRFNAALGRTVAAGFILRADVPEIRALAAYMFPLR